MAVVVIPSFFAKSACVIFASASRFKKFIFLACIVVLSMI